jgi:hypothetical protein
VETILEKAILHQLLHGLVKLVRGDGAEAQTAEPLGEFVYAEDTVSRVQQEKQHEPPPVGQACDPFSMDSCFVLQPVKTVHSPSPLQLPGRQRPPRRKVACCRPHHY